MNHTLRAKKASVRFSHLIPLKYMQASSPWPFLWYGHCSGQTLLNRRKKDQTGTALSSTKVQNAGRFWIEWAAHWWVLAVSLSFSHSNHLSSRFSFPDHQGPEALYHRGWDVADWFVHSHMLADCGSPEENCGRVQLGGEFSCLLLMLCVTMKQISIFWP